jgi:pimeloyl-ACP methyl ester carboxylesterase
VEGESRESLIANGFPIVALWKDATPTASSAESVAIVFIEGDGLPWTAPSIPSLDPTPQKPVALELFRSTAMPAIYLGRPCYWSGMPAYPCRPFYWTGARFAPELLESMLEALQNVRQRLNARKIILVGYSGGGVLAALMAHRVHDVIGVIAIAAPVAHDRWTQRLELEPLSHSLNPGHMSGSGHLEIPEILLFGARDRIVQPADAGAYSRRPNARTIVIEDADHACCWLNWWQTDGLRFVRTWAQASDSP